MMQDEELVRFERQFRVGLSLVVRELDLVGALQDCNNRSYLTAQPCAATSARGATTSRSRGVIT
jgi:hypothetical protein